MIQSFTDIIFILFAGIFIACPICSAILARTKGRDVTAWLLLGLVFGPFGLIAAAGMPAIDVEERLARKGLSRKLKLCGSCREAVWADATVCSHCSSPITKAV